MIILQRAFVLRAILTLVCMVAFALMLLPTTGQAFAAGHIPQKITYASTSGNHAGCLLLQVQLQGNTPPKVQCLLAQSSANTLSPQSVAQKCNDHMKAPWVALYWDLNYGEPDICFLGRGTVNLGDYGWANEASSVNIAANGVFFDQDPGDGNQLPFHYGMEISDLRTIDWNDRIAYLRIDS